LVIIRLVELIRHATEKPKPRIATKPTKASKTQAGNQAAA